MYFQEQPIYALQDDPTDNLSWIFAEHRTLILLPGRITKNINKNPSWNVPKWSWMEKGDVSEPASAAQKKRVC